MREPLMDASPGNSTSVSLMLTVNKRRVRWCKWAACVRSTDSRLLCRGADGEGVKEGVRDQVKG